MGQSLQKNCIDGVSISFYYFQSLVYSNYSMEISNIELTSQRGDVKILRDKATVINQTDESIKHYQKTFRFSQNDGSIQYILTHVVFVVNSTQQNQDSARDYVWITNSNCDNKNYEWNDKAGNKWPLIFDEV